MAGFTAGMTGSGGYTLTLWVVQASQNVAANSSVVNWSLVAQGNWGSWGNNAAGWSVNIGGQIRSGTINGYNPNPSQTIASGSVTIAHNSDGTKSISCAGYWDSGHSSIGSGNPTGSMALTTIARASQSSWASGTPSQTLAGSTYQLNTNRASTGFLHNITYTFGAASGTIGTNVGGSVNWTIPLSLLNRVPNTTYGTGTIITKTYSGGTLIGTRNSTFAAHAPASIVPNWSSISVSEGNSAVTSKVGSGAYVQGVSRASYTISGASGAYSSTITQQKFQVAGQTLLGASGTSAPIASSGNSVPAVFTITDSRGRQKTQTQNIKVLPYSTPKINSLTVKRSLSTGTLSEQGTYVRVSLNSSVSSLVNGTEKNTRTIRVRAKLRGSTTSWSHSSTLKQTVTGSGVSGTNNFTVTGPFDLDKAYEVRVEVIDQFNTSSSDTTIATASVFMHWGNGLGVGKFHEIGSIDASGAIYQNNGNAVVDVTRTATTSRTGIVEMATQAEVNAGSLSGARSIDPFVLRNRNYAAYSEAGGRVTTSASSIITVTFPSGRFTQIPLVNGQQSSGGVVSVAYITSRSTTSFQVRSYTLGAAQNSIEVEWQAKQMTSSSAEG